METEDACNLFIKYLPSNVDDEKLKECFFFFVVKDQFFEVFSRFGDVISAKVMVDSICSESLGYGFVRFATAGQAQYAIETMNYSKVL
jgi:RNA recognition motif-containing protein